MQTHPVRALIAERRRSGSLPGRRTDAHRLALVIEGGGMRAVAAGGMVWALEELGLREAFDAIFGSSAGAIAGAYFAAGQARFGTRMFYEDLNNRRFIDLSRPWRLKPIMDVGFLVDHVMRIDKPLDVAAVLGGPLPVHIVATDIGEGRAEVMHRFADATDFSTFLGASATIPFIGGGPVLYKGRTYFDGGLVQQIAVESAVDWGASHVLVLTMRRRSDIGLKRRRWNQRGEEILLDVLYGKPVGDLYRRREDTIDRSIDLCLSTRRQRELGVEIELVTLSEGMTYLSRLTTDAALLRRGDLDARAIIQALGLVDEGGGLPWR